MDFPFKVQYARFERPETCKRCKRNFEERELRMAVMTQSRRRDLKYPYWYHTACLFKSFDIQSVDHIESFETIEYDDQLGIMKKIYPKLRYREIVDKRKAANDEPNALKNYGVERMTVDRGSCISCKEKFQRGDVIVMRIVFDSKTSSKYGRDVKWNHLECFATKRKFLRYELSGIYLPGFDELDEDGQDEVNDMLPSLATPDETDKLLRNHKKCSDFSKLSGVELELLIASQTDDLTKVLKGLASTFGKTSLQKFLAANGSVADGNYTTLLNRCADFLTFGAIEKCQKCGKGDMIFTKHGYTCNAMKLDFIPCANFKKNPKRSLCVVPRELADGSSKKEAFLATCNLVVSNRAVRKNENIAFDYKTIFDDEAFKSTEPEKNLKFKNGTAVDPESGKQEEAHVYKEDELAYSTVLNLVDIKSDKNSFFTMQVLQSDSKENEFWLFTNGGRIKTTIKNPKTTSYKTAKEACDKFEEIFKLKTANSWNSKKPFEKCTGMFYVQDVQYDDNIAANVSVPSKLIEKVENLMKVLFNVQTMNRAMKEYKLDLEKMPLGKLSTKQLQEAQQTLDDLKNAITKNRSPEFICGLTNKFFTLIPHSFDLAAIPVLDTPRKVKEKREMVKALVDMQVAYDIMKKAPPDQNSFEAYYMKLNAEVLPLDPNSEDFKLIQKYATNTAPGSTFQVVEAFKIDRKGERERYAKFKSLPNKMLLWHGSGVTNFASIIAQGLIIGPTRGLFFADMLLKSLGYCRSRDANGCVYLVLCEVALGTMQPNVRQISAGYQSAKLIAHFQPNPQEAHTCKNGVVIPLGRIIPAGVPSSCNEFIVFDIAQVRIRYLVKMK